MARRPVLALLAALTITGTCGCCCRMPCRRAPCAEPARAIVLDFHGPKRGDTVPGEAQIFVDLTIARIPEDHVARVLGADRPVRASEPRPLSRERARALATAWSADPQVRVRSAPKLLALPGQKATVFIGETLRLARTEARTNERGGLEFSIEEEAGSPLDVGERIEVVARPNEAGNRVSLDIVGTWTEWIGGTAPEAPGAMAAMDYPRFLRTHRLTTAFEMASGSWVLIGNPAWIDADDGRVLQVVLLSAHVITPRDAATHVISGR